MPNQRKSKLRKRKVNIFMRWSLQIRGCNDAKNNIPDKSEKEGYENYYFTPFIGEQIAEIISIAQDEFSKLQTALAKLNESINNLNHKSEARFQKAVQDIHDIQREISINKSKSQTPQTIAVNDALEADITSAEKKARIDIQQINAEGTKDENDAKKLVEDFNISFKEGLGSCVERLAIYWASLYIKNKKLNTGIKINAQLPTPKELLCMCNSVNPSTEHPINHYVVIDIEEIEKIRSRK